MKMDVASLTYEEFALLMKKLQEMNMDATVSRRGQTVILQIEPPEQKVSRKSAIEIPYLF